MTNDSNDILYREFFIQTTRDKLIEMTEDLIHDERVKDFGKMESDLCKTDARTVVTWIDWVLPLLKAHYPATDTKAQNRIRMMMALRSKLNRRIDR